MLIRDLEAKSGLDRATIRYYEKEGLINPLRKENGYREYTDENLTHLLKIKLLRQLGISVYTIKQIQQGSADFSKALSDQILILERQINAAARAKEVCTELYQANARYDTLDAAYYLYQLSRQDSIQKKPSFREIVIRPYHPVRRFLARLTDYMLVEIFLEFLMVVVLRIRPFEGFLSNLISYGVPFLMIPVNAWMLSKWGTTPGKWLYDLSVLSENGCTLGFTEAAKREWQVLKDGYGFGIPVWSLARMAKSYKTYQDYEPDWDWSIEYQYGSWERKRRIALTAVAVLVAAMTLVGAFDVVKPRYRGEITIAQYASNYNFYNKIINDQASIQSRMLPDGTWYPVSNNSVTIYLDGEPQNPRQSFEFSTSETFVQSIRYENTWKNVGMLHPVTSKCQTAAITALMSQKGMGLSDLHQLTLKLDHADLLDDGNVTYKNIEITWDIETENCIRLGDLYLTANDDKLESWASVVFEIRILSQ